MRRSPGLDRFSIPLFLIALALLDACGDGDSHTSSLTLAASAPPAATSAAGQALAEPLVIEVRDPSGNPVQGVDVAFRAALGGGSVAPATGRSDANGQVSVVWTLGVAPVANRLVASAGDAEAIFDVRATLAAPLEPAPFGDVNAFLQQQGVTGSTEDLAFDGAERMFMGVPGGLITLDPAGAVARASLSGDALVTPLGIAFDRKGNLWIADSNGHALRRMDGDGRVTTVLTSDGTQSLGLPNYVAVDRKDRVYFSDSCLGEVIRFDPETATVDAVLQFDLATEGGANGLAFDASGDHLFITTENTALFCGHTFVGLTDPVAQLSSVEVSDAGFGARDVIAERFGLFGDGLAFDREGNLFTIFDTEKNLALDESIVWVFPAGTRDPVKFLVTRDRVMANLAFGAGAFDAKTLYVALLAVPPFTPVEARGAQQIRLGIEGLPVPP
jgi:sugar lactone lactonase YvrE